MHIFVDGMLSGTGLRDAIKGGYIEPEDLGISSDLQVKISVWLERYANLHYANYKDDSEIHLLDNEGIEICKILKKEMPDIDVKYYSNAKLETIPFVF